MQDLTKPTEKTPINDTPFSFGQTDEIKVDLASPWERMGAVVLNWLFLKLVFIPTEWLLSLIFPIHTKSISLLALILLIIIIFIPFKFIYWQLTQYSRRGQTLGKKIVGIRVIREDGGKLGSEGVILRESLTIAMIFIGNPGNASINNLTMGNTIALITTLTCVVMMFVAHKRRTLQDMLAKTVVIKVPKKQK